MIYSNHKGWKAMQQTRYVVGRYDPEENILHLWHPNPTFLNTPEILKDFFNEVTFWLRSCPTRPYLLVNYANVDITVDLTTEYSRQVKIYHPMVLGVFRYGISASLNGSFTTMTVRMGNMKNSMASNLYPDETSARAAIRKQKQTVSQ